MNFYSNLTIFYLTSPHFEGKLTSFVAILAQNRCVCGSRPELYYSKGNFIIKVHEAWDWNQWISTPTSPFSMKQVPILKENELVLLLF